MSQSISREAEIAAVYDRHANMLYRVAMSHLNNSEDAQDAVQDVFARYISAAPTFSDEEQERAWLIRVTVNHCRDILKSPWRKRRVSRTELSGASEEPVFAMEEQKTLFQAVMALPEKYRMVLYLFYYEELSVREMAVLLNLSQTAVTTRLSRAREKLKLQLTEVWEKEQ